MIDLLSRTIDKTINPIAAVNFRVFVQKVYVSIAVFFVGMELPLIDVLVFAYLYAVSLSNRFIE